MEATCCAWGKGEFFTIHSFTLRYSNTLKDTLKDLINYTLNAFPSLQLQILISSVKKACFHDNYF